MSGSSYTQTVMVYATTEDKLHIMIRNIKACINAMIKIRLARYFTITSVYNTLSVYVW